jgi:superfamily I DNA/RNA helicase
VIAKEYGNRYDAILVDEFQDTNPIQIELLEALLGNVGALRATPFVDDGRAATGNDGSGGTQNDGAAGDGAAPARKNATLFAVGDDDQAIYGFQGADIRTIRNFTARFRDARIVKLQINYRSITSILNCANRLWVDKPEEYRKTLVSGLSSQPSGCRKPQTARFPAWEHLLEWSLDRAYFIQRKENIPIRSMAMLFRLNDTLDSAARYFDKKGLSENDRPQLLTVHASKGLEYPVVFLCDMEEGMFPHYKLPKETRIDTWPEFFKAVLKSKKDITDPSCDLGEELRLFYVAVTRAQRFLYFLTAAKKPFHDKTVRFRPSRFLKLVR